MRALNLNTVCEEAGCPNIGECWAKRHATMMILGAVCTRACAFCNVATGLPDKLDPHEPAHVAEAVAKLGLAHVVITSVDRDDLEDGGAAHFAEVIARIRDAAPETTVEILTPDFQRKQGAIETVVAARPDVFNHNLETVPRLYPSVRPGARYFASLRLLQRVKELDPAMFTKSGIMVGLGEGAEEVRQVMDDLRAADVDFLTIGQYLQPTPKHHPIDRFVTPDEFAAYAGSAARQGLPAGVVLAAHPVVLPCGRGFREAARSAPGAPRRGGGLGCPVTPKPAPCRTRRSGCSIWSPTSSPTPSSCPGASARAS